MSSDRLGTAMVGSAVTDRLSTGIDGLDEITNGGFLAGRSFLVRGPPGAGKSLLGLHFLTAEAAATPLFVNMGEPAADVRENAASFGFDLDVELLDLSPDADAFVDRETYTVFASGEVEGAPLAEEIGDAVEAVDPDRVFVDPMTQLRYLAPDAHQFRRQVLSFLRYLKGHGATVLFTSQDSPNTPDDDLQFMADGVVHLDRGSVRTVEVQKFRGSDFQSGSHTARITDEGLVVSPQLRPRAHSQTFEPVSIPSGVPELDELLQGGIDRGTVTIVSGPTGVGKTTTGTQFVKEAAGRGERSVIYSFEESRETLVHRSESLNIPVEAMLERETLAIEELGTRDRSVDEFTRQLRRDVEANGTRIVMIDGIDGFRQGLAGEGRDVARELHDIGRYLKNVGVTTILVNEVGTITGEFEATEENVSYLADNILFLRYVELRGELRKAVGVLKKRTGDFDRRLRKLEMTEHGVKVGEPLTGLRGILTGTPEWAGDGAGWNDGTD
jgi:circadian clock protein KaiC